MLKIKHVLENLAGSSCMSFKHLALYSFKQFKILKKKYRFY